MAKPPSNEKAKAAAKPNLRARKDFINKSLQLAENQDPEDEEQEEDDADQVYDSEADLVKTIGYGPRFSGGLAGAQEYVNTIVRNPKWLTLSRNVGEVKLYSLKDKEFFRILQEYYGQDKITPQLAAGNVLAMASVTNDPNKCVIGLDVSKRQAFSAVVILHEMAHVARGIFNHGQDFQRAYLTLLKEFLPETVNKQKIIDFLTREFKLRGLSTKLFNLGKVAGSKEKLLLDKSKLKKKRSR